MHAYHKCSLNGPSSSSGSARDRPTLRNGESNSVERQGAHERDARICLRGQLDSGTRCVATIFADTSESVKQRISKADAYTKDPKDAARLTVLIRETNPPRARLRFQRASIPHPSRPTNRELLNPFQLTREVTHALPSFLGELCQTFPHCMVQHCRSHRFYSTDGFWLLFQNCRCHA